METISHVVRGSPRVPANEIKHTAPHRPTGSPAFQAAEAKAEAMQNHEEAFKQKQFDKAEAVNNMADQFFMSHIRRPEDEVAQEPIESREARPRPSISDDDMGPSSSMIVRSAQDGSTVEAPRGYKPRGSYLDVHA